MSDMSLEVFQPKGAHDKPELERPETSAERNLPVLRDRKKVMLLDVACFYDGYTYDLVNT